MSRDPLRVVCFDLGGVLVRICQSWGEACELTGLPRRDLSAECQQRRRQVVDRYQRGELDCAGYHAAMSSCLEGAYSESELERIHTAWTREEYPGVHELVSALNRQSGVVTACLSNTNHAHWQRLSGADGRAEYPSVQGLRHQLASHLLGRLKPDREIYAMAHEQFRGGRELAPEDIIFFDDLAENIEGARSLGWQAFRVDPNGDTAAQMRAFLSGAKIRV